MPSAKQIPVRVEVKSSALQTTALLLSTTTAALALPSAIASALPNLIQYGTILAFIVANYRRLVAFVFDALPLHLDQLSRDVIVVSALTFVALNIESWNKNGKSFLLVLNDVLWSPVRSSREYVGVFSIAGFLPNLMYSVLSAPILLLTAIAAAAGGSVSGIAGVDALSLAALAVLFFLVVQPLIGWHSLSDVNWGVALLCLALCIYAAIGARWINRESLDEEQGISKGALGEGDGTKEGNPWLRAIVEIVFLPVRLVFVAPIFIAVAIANSLRTIMLTAGALTLLLVINEGLSRLATAYQHQ